MSRNQQILILVLAIVFSAALVVGAYLKKNPGAFKRDGGQQQVQQQDPYLVRPPAQNVVDNNKHLSPEVQKNLQDHQNYQKRLQESRNRPAYVNQAPGHGFNPEANVAVGEVVGQLRLLGASLTRAVSRRTVKMEYFERLSFGGASDGVDPNYAVFNPDGLIKFKPMLGKWISQETLNNVSAAKKGRLIYSLRRQKDKYGGTTDVLYAVVPFPTDGLCKMARFSTKIGAVLPFAADNRTVVEDPPGTLEKKYFKESLCVTMSDGKRVFLYPLRLRHMTKGTNNWQSY